jgi:hypothetical protein
MCTVSLVGSTSICGRLLFPVLTDFYLGSLLILRLVTTVGIELRIFE